MTDHMVIPDEAITYILFQRTGYLRIPVGPIYRLLNKLLPFETPLYNLVTAFEARFRAAKIKALYEGDMQQEYHSIREYLPTTCSTILDIGCGVAGIDVFIQGHYANPDMNFYLLDKTLVERNVFYLFKPHGAFYNSLDVARTILVNNGISVHHVHLLEADDTHGINMSTKPDLVISLISWGFHYPVETYVDNVHALLSDQGVVILDVRKGTGGLDVLRSTFHHVDLIFEGKKHYRVVAKKASDAHPTGTPAVA